MKDEDGGQQNCIGQIELKKPYMIGVIMITVILGLTLGLVLGPKRASITIITMIILYMIATSIAPRARIIFLAMAAALHVGAIVSYYSNPIVLPLVIIEQTQNKYSLNIDIVQLAILYEARLQIQTLKTCSQRQPENTKTPEQEITTMEPLEEPR